MNYKILFVHGNSNNIGGQEIALLNTILGLRNLNIESIVILPDKRRFNQLLNDNQVKTYCLNLNNFSKKQLLWYIRTIYSICKVIKNEGVSIIHCSGAYPTQYCLPAAKLTKIPCIAHIHSTIYSQWDIKKSFVPQANYIIAVSNAVRKMLINYGCSALKTKTIYCGVIDSNIVDNKNESGRIRDLYSIPSDYKIVGQISLISPLKGLEYFLEMAIKIKKNYTKVKFMIIGNAAAGYEYYEAELKNMANKLGLTKDIIFTGFQKEINKFISALDVIVLSSLIEGLPFSIVESLALGKPVVATSVGGVPEVIIDNQTGILVPPKDSDALTKAILSLLENPTEAKKLGENGRQFVLEKFNISNHATKLAQVYRELIHAC